MVDLPCMVEPQHSIVKVASPPQPTRTGAGQELPLSGRKMPGITLKGSSKSSRQVLLVCHTWQVTIRQPTRQRGPASNLECRASKRRSWQRSSLRPLRTRKTACSTMRAKIRCLRLRSTRSHDRRKRSYHSSKSVTNKEASATIATKGDEYGRHFKGIHTGVKPP